MSDRLGSTLSFFGRLTDDLRREPAGAGEFRVTLGSPPKEASYKQDGHFAFADLRPSALPYSFLLLDGLYQGRQFDKALPGAAPVELAYDGEDETYVLVKAVNAGSKQITFDAIPFLPKLRRGAPVLGVAGFSTTLAEDLAGVDATTAVLTSVAGLATGTLLRLVRSRSLCAKAGPYYSFPEGTTLLYLRVVEDVPEELPLAGVRIRIAKLNGVTPSSATVSGVVLRTLSLAGPPVQELILGKTADLDTFTEGRGNAVFYFPGHWSLSALELELSCSGYVTATLLVPLAAGQRTSLTAKLAAV